MPNETVTEFKIDIPEDALSDVRERLARTRWTDESDAEPWLYGPPLDYMRRTVDHWLHRYDWRQQEAALNRFRHFTTQLDGLDVHFIHEPGAGPAPLPLILTHGWPGSFLEFARIIPMLTDPARHGGRPEDSFTVVVPSIPGHGFSSRPSRAGFNYADTADLWAALMTRLGYTRFGAQGGDWGSWVTAALGLQHPGRIIGVHLNYLSTRFRPGVGEHDDPLSAEEQRYLEQMAAWGEAEGGYIAIQATKPQSLGYGLADSPVGLAAWLLEKFKAWSDCSDVPEEAIPLDAILTNIMIYWLTNTAQSAARFYSGSRERPFHLAPGQKITPPCGVANFPRDISNPPRSWAERAFNVTHWSTMPRGGHFAAMEQPELLAEDIRTFFRPLRG